MPSWAPARDWLRQMQLSPATEGDGHLQVTSLQPCECAEEMREGQGLVTHGPRLSSLGVGLPPSSASCIPVGCPPPWYVAVVGLADLSFSVEPPEGQANGTVSCDGVKKKNVPVK